MTKNYPAQNTYNTAVDIFCFIHKEIEEIIYSGIHEFGDLRTLSVYFDYEYQGSSYIFIFSEYLSISSVDFFKRLLSSIIFEWKLGKAKGNPFDRYLFKIRLYSDA